jgi:hypothetical protein
LNDETVNRALMKAIGVFFTELSGAKELPSLGDVAQQWAKGAAAQQTPQRPPQTQPEDDPTPTEDELMARKLRMISLRAAAYPRSEEAAKQQEDADRAMRLLTDQCAYIVILQYYVELLDDARDKAKDKDLGDYQVNLAKRINHIMESIYVLPDNAPARLDELKKRNNTSDLNQYAACWDRIQMLTEALFQTSAIDMDDYNQILFKLGSRPDVLVDEEEAA